MKKMAELKCALHLPTRLQASSTQEDAAADLQQNLRFIFRSKHLQQLPPPPPRPKHTHTQKAVARKKCLALRTATHFKINEF
jgi:hypothetical protein